MFLIWEVHKIKIIPKMSTPKRHATSLQNQHVPPTENFPRSNLLILCLMLSFFSDVVWKRERTFGSSLRYFFFDLFASQNTQKQTMRNRTIITSLLLFYWKFYHSKWYKNLSDYFFFFSFWGTRVFLSFSFRRRLS